MKRKRVEVAIGVLVDRTSAGVRVLIARRRHDTVLAGFWEFPGGKIEAGETPRDCLVREFEEELGLRVVVGDSLELIEHEYDYAHVRLHPFICERSPGDRAPAQNLAVAEHRWVTPAELGSFQFPPANVGLVDRVARALSESRDNTSIA